MGVLRQPLVTADPTTPAALMCAEPSTFGNAKLKGGDKLTAEELASIPRPTFGRLVNTGKIQLWPAAPLNVRRRAVRRSLRSFGKFLVIEGRQLTKKPVTKEDAQKLAAQG
jgi:hypothetical protein